jgi:hypothetical protein
VENRNTGKGDAQNAAHEEKGEIVMSRENDIPAFPTLNEHQAGAVTWHYSGLTKREFFASQADIPWAVAAEIVYRLNSNQNGSPMQIMQQRALMCFSQADEMIKESAK